MPTGIDYLDEVWNPITGCSGKCCKAHCWACDMVRRFPLIHGEKIEGFAGTRWDYEPNFNKVQFHPDRLDKPLHWKKPRRIGVCFMGDLFDEQVPFEWVKQVLDKASLIDCEQHQFFFLTKQVKRMKELVCLWAKEQESAEYRDEWKKWIRDNWWFGVSITDQEDADRMIPELLKMPVKKCVSVEPMLGPVDLRHVHHDNTVEIDALTGDHGVIRPLQGRSESRVDWVVLGCESGPKRRPCHQEWMIDVVRQCKAADVPVWVKQVDMGERVSHDPAEWPEELSVQEQSAIGRPM